jgi:dihydrofolate reductase
MRRVIESTLVSLDGVIGDPQLWANEYFDEEAERSALEQLLVSDAMLMGRNTYEMFAAAWPNASGDYPDRMNAIPKYVFSNTLAEVNWTNATIVRGDPAAAVRQLKEQDGGDLVMYGHGPLGQALLENGQLDELRFWLHPLIVGCGTPLFRAGANTALKLVATETLATGVVVLTYQPAREPHPHHTRNTE